MAIEETQEEKFDSWSKTDNWSSWLTGRYQYYHRELMVKNNYDHKSEEKPAYIKKGNSHNAKGYGRQIDNKICYHQEENQPSFPWCQIGKNDDDYDVYFKRLLKFMQKGCQRWKLEDRCVLVQLAM